MSAKSKEELVQEFRTREIEAAAVRVLADKGLAGATMRAIAEEAGVAKGTIYLYFQNRADLLQRAADGTYTELLERLESVLGKDLRFGQKVQTLVLTLLDFVDSHRDFFRLYLAIRYGGSDVAEGSRLQRPRISQYQTYLKRLAEFLETAIDPSLEPALDPDKLAFFMSEAINAVLIHRLEEADPAPAEREAQWITDLLLHGMAIREKGGAGGGE